MKNKKNRMGYRLGDGYLDRIIVENIILGRDTFPLKEQKGGTMKAYLEEELKFAEEKIEEAKAEWNRALAVKETLMKVYKEWTEGGKDVHR